MSYLKDDYADQDCDEQNEDNEYDEQAQETSDYDASSQDEVKKIKTHLQSDDEKAEASDEDNPKDEEDDLESIEELQEHLMIIDLITDVKKQELDLNDEFQGLDVKPNAERITSPFISKYEKAMVIGKRAQQIGKNSAIYVALSDDEVKRMSALEIAQREYENGTIPMIIRRWLPDKTFEDWKIKELKRHTWEEGIN